MHNSPIRISLVACLALALTALYSTDALSVDLTNGVVGQFHDKDGTRRDKFAVVFKREPGLGAPLPSATGLASSITLRYRATDTGTTSTIGPVALPSEHWREKFPAEHYQYKDRDRSAAGVRKIQFYSARSGADGGLLIKGKGDAYGLDAVSGPVDWVEVAFNVGATSYCGRFDAVNSLEKKNDASRVHFVGGSTACGSTSGTTTTTTTTTTLPGGNNIRVPAEWEEQEAVWLQWPGPFEKTYEPAYAEMSNVIVQYQKLHILHDTNLIRNQARNAISSAGGDPDHPNITWHSIANDNAWMRDNGPTYVVQNGQMRIQDWGFDAWGGAFGPNVPFAADDAVPPQVAAYLGMPVDTVNIVHERGNLEFNGVDSVILNWSTIGDPNRNPGYTQAQAIADMQHYFGVTNVVLIEGYLPDDFTRGHVDGIARFINPTTVVVGQCTVASACQPGDSDAAVFDDAAADIAAAGFTVIREPFEGTASYNGGPAFSTDYMNWLVGNGFVIAVGFENPTTNAAAKARLESYYPNRDVYVIDMLASWDAGGGAHCHTNDQPAASTVAGYTPWMP